MPEQPFVGPRPFESRDQPFFFGRDQEAAQLLDLIYAEPCCVLYSRSGLGKSSLIHAALRPRLEQEGWHVLPTGRVTGGALPSEDYNPFVWAVIESTSRSAPGTEGPAHTLAEHLSKCATMPGAGILLVLDQFEELFTYAGTNAPRKDFFQQLGDAIRSLTALRVLISIREEFLADLESYRRYIPRQFTGRLRLNLLNRSAAILAVDGPLQANGITMEPEAMNALLDLLTQEWVYTADRTLQPVSGEWVEPVHLQIVAYQLWQSLPQGATRLTLPNVQGLEQWDPLTKFYTDCIDAASRETGIKAVRILTWCYEALITPAGTRALVYAGADDTAGMPNSVVSALERKHLLRTELRAGAKWIELSHDQFIRPVDETYRGWDRQVVEAINRARGWIERARKWDAAGRTSDEGLNQQEIHDAESWLSEEAAAEVSGSALLKNFIEYSSLANERALRRSRRLRLQITTLVIFLLAALGFGWWAFAQKRAAENQREMAEFLALEAKKQTDNALAQERYAQSQNKLATENYQKSVDALRAQQQAELEKERLAQKLQQLQTLSATAYQLKLRSQEIRDTSNESSQKKLNLALLSAQATYNSDKKTITHDADEAMRGAWPSLAKGGSGTITGNIAIGGAFFLVQLGSTTNIYKIREGMLWRSVDLDRWMPSPRLVQLSSKGSRLLISSAGFSKSVEQAVILDISGDTPKKIFEQSFPRFTDFVSNAAMTLLIARGSTLVGSQKSPDAPSEEVWNVDGQAKIAILGRPSRLLIFGPNDRIIGLNSDGSVLAWDRPYVASTTLAESGFADTGSLAALSDGTLVLGASDGRILKLDKNGIKTELPRFDFPQETTYQYLGIVAHPDRPAFLAVGNWREPPNAPGSQGRIMHSTVVYNPADGSTTPLGEDSNYPWNPRFLADGRIAAPGPDGSLSILNNSTSPETLQIVPRPSFGLSLSQQALAFVSREGLLNLFVPSHSDDPSSLWQTSAAKLPATGASTLIAQPTSTRALVAYFDGHILLGDLVSGDITRTYPHGPALFDFAVSSDWSTFASVGSDGRLCLWNLSSDHPMRQLQAHSGPIRAVAVSQDGGTVVTAGEDNTLKVWRTREESSAPSQTFHTDTPVNALILKNNDLIAGAEDGSVTRWDLGNGHSKTIRWAIGSKFPVHAMAITPDGTRLAINAPDANGGNNSLHVLRFPSGELWLRIEQYAAPVRRITFDPNGANVIGISENGQVRIDPLDSIDLMTRLRRLLKTPFTHQQCLDYAATVPSICPQ